MTVDLNLRAARDDDARLVWTCRKELEGTAAVQSAMPDFDTHCAWMARAVRSQNDLFLICEHAGAGAGYVRFDALQDEPGWRVSIGLLAAVQGRGLGRRALADGCAFAEDRNLTPLYADIHATNAASQRVFESCGFAPLTPVDGTEGFRRYRRLPDAERTTP